MADKRKRNRLAYQLSPQGSAIATQNSETEDEVKLQLNQILSVYQGSNSSGTRKRLADWYTEQWTLDRPANKGRSKARLYQMQRDGTSNYKVPDGATGSWEAVLVGFIGKNRCKRCGRRGHNRQTYHGPVFY